MAKLIGGAGTGRTAGGTGGGGTIAGCAGGGSSRGALLGAGDSAGRPGAGDSTRLAQAPRASAHSIDGNAAERGTRFVIWETVEMMWLALEIALGLALFVFIVWWTLPRGKQKRPEEPPDAGP